MQELEQMAGMEPRLPRRRFFGFVFFYFPLVLLKLLVSPIGGVVENEGLRSQLAHECWELSGRVIWMQQQTSGMP